MNHRKPTAVKKREGNPGKRKLNRFEAHPQLEIPPCPKHFDSIARDEWNRVTPLLLDLGLITALDLAPLAGYCLAFSRWVKAEKEVQREGILIEGRQGPVKNPAVMLAEHSLEQIRRFCIEFGMTPAARSKVEVNPKSNPEADLHAKLSGPELTDAERKQQVQ